MLTQFFTRCPTKQFYTPSQRQGCVLRFDYKRGQDTIDKSNNSNHGTLSDVNYTSNGWYPTSAYGGNSKITVNNNASLYTPALTVEFWVYMPNPGADLRRIFDKNNRQLYLSGTNIRFEQKTSGTQGAWTFGYTTSTLIHVMMSYDSANLTTKPLAIVNGVEKTVTEASAATGTPTSDLLDILYIMNRAAGARCLASSYMQYFAWYNRQMSVAEMQGIYNAVKNKYQYN